MCTYAPRHARSRGHPVLISLAATMAGLAVIAAALLPVLHQGPPAGPAAPQTAASAPAPVHTTPAAPGPHATARPHVAPLTRYTVRPGDSLWSIAQRELGNGANWPRIWAANRGTVDGHPDLIRPGQVLTLPPDLDVM